MDIFSSSFSQQKFIRGLNLGAGLALFTFSILLIWQAFHFPQDANFTIVHIGPLELMQISKATTSSHTYILNFQWLPGLVWYSLLWVGISMVFVFYRKPS